MKKFIFTCLFLNFFSCNFYSFTGASISPEIKNFSVSYFPNKSEIINASLSTIFTEKLKEIFVRQTNLIHVSNNGDLSFQGEIIGYSIKPISISSDETARQNRLTIKILVEFINSSDDNLNFKSTFTRYKDFPSDQDFNEFEEIFLEEICDEIVEDIFNKAVVNW